MICVAWGQVTTVLFIYSCLGAADAQVNKVNHSKAGKRKAGDGYASASSGTKVLKKRRLHQ